MNRASRYYIENVKLREAAQRVRTLHRPTQGPYDNVVCEACSHMDINVDFHTDYPCLTIKALDGETK